MRQASMFIGLAVWCLLDICFAQVIESDDYFYGESPPIYPSPPGTGLGGWAAAYQKATAFVAQLTQDEKSNLTNGLGYGGAMNGCAGSIYPIERLNFPGLCLQDGGVLPDFFCNLI